MTNRQKISQVALVLLVIMAFSLWLALAFEMGRMVGNGEGYKERNVVAMERMLPSGHQIEQMAKMCLDIHGETK